MAKTFVLNFKVDSRSKFVEHPVFLILSLITGVIFAPCNFRPSSLANCFAPFLIRPDTVVFKER